MKSTLTAVMLIAFLTCSGCANGRQNALEKVAKDWSMTIRAAQVMPVYPLTEDLQPGDVFLVQTPIGRQADVWKDRGYLPLDMHVTRLDLKDKYAATYGDAYWDGSFSTVPHDRGERPKPDADGNVVPIDAQAPIAAFPSYNFDVTAGSGLRLAIPVSSVPVGLGLMSTNRAKGSVQISEAFTYGLPIDQVLPVFQDWVHTPEVQAELRSASALSTDTLFLRVVTRVYMTGGVTVSMHNLDSGSFGLDAGAPQNIDLTTAVIDDPASADATIEAYKKAAATQRDTLNALTDNLPGGSVRVAYASNRSVTMQERFQRPLVIGYLGYDVAVDSRGHVSAVIPTFELINKRFSPILSDVTIGVLSEQQRAINHRYLEIMSNRFSNPKRKVVVTYLLDTLPPDAIPESLAQSDEVGLDTPDDVNDLFEAIYRELGTYSTDNDYRQRLVVEYLDAAIERTTRP